MIKLVDTRVFPRETDAMNRHRAEVRQAGARFEIISRPQIVGNVMTSAALFDLEADLVAAVPAAYEFEPPVLAPGAQIAAGF